MNFWAMLVCAVNATEAAATSATAGIIVFAFFAGADRPGVGRSPLPAHRHATRGGVPGETGGLAVGTAWQLAQITPHPHPAPSKHAAMVDELAKRIVRT